MKFPFDWKLWEQKLSLSVGRKMIEDFHNGHYKEIRGKGIGVFTEICLNISNWKHTLEKCALGIPLVYKLIVSKISTPLISQTISVYFPSV